MPIKFLVNQHHEKQTILETKYKRYKWMMIAVVLILLLFIGVVCGIEFLYQEKKQEGTIEF